MSTPDAAVAAAEAGAAAAEAGAAAATGRGRRRRRLLLMALPVLAGGGGAGLWFSGLLKPAAPDPDAHRPQLVKAKDAGPGQPRYVTSYLRLEGPFTTNLAGSSRFVQVELGVSTRYDARVFEAVRAHELAVRSAVLGVLASSPEAAVTTPEGRAALQQRLVAAINAELERRAGFGGIEGVHFIGLVVQ
jgi:flagellar FliL protein